MPPADRLIVGKPAPADEHGHGQRPGAIAKTGVVPQAKAATGLTPPSPAAGGLTASGVAAESVGAVADLLHSQAAEPGGLSSRHHDTGAGLPASGALDRLSERALILAAAHESSTHAGWAAGSNVGEATLEPLDADVRRLATDYVHIPPPPMFAEMLRVRNRIYWLLTGRQQPAASAQLHLLAGMLCGRGA